jgi:hypothetical protein
MTKRIDHPERARRRAEHRALMLIVPRDNAPDSGEFRHIEKPAQDRDGLVAKALDSMPDLQRAWFGAR